MRRVRKPSGVISAERQYWKPLDVRPVRSSTPAGLALTGETHQAWQGFGGCFNELGWAALSALDKSKREAVLAELFDPRGACRFTYCRLPIGASDYARSWYSLNETGGDFAMRRFSIDRDRNNLIPYIRAALRYRSDITLFASPWSPPTWMKNPPAYNYGRLIGEKRYRDAYALYFVKFVQAYEREGITVGAVHVQNEPCADQKFPSCLWSGAEMRDFIRNHLAPAFAKHGITAKIWLGTLNTDDYNGYANTVLADPVCRRVVGGVGYQWGGKHAIARTVQAYPGVPVIQTENECGDGENTWEFALYVFDLMRHYISCGALAYVYWNMVLEPRGRSTWGWHQNSLVTIDANLKRVSYNPEFFVMKHAARFVAPGAVRVGLSGAWSSNAFAFRNGDGSEVYCVNNVLDQARTLVVDTGAGTFAAVCAPRSVSTIVV